jgi:hypothetical protein
MLAPFGIKQMATLKTCGINTGEQLYLACIGQQAPHFLQQFTPVLVLCQVNQQTLELTHACLLYRLISA